MQMAQIHDLFDRRFIFGVNVGLVRFCSVLLDIGMNILFVIDLFQLFKERVTLFAVLMYA